MKKPTQSSSKPQVTEEKYPTGKPQVTEGNYSQLTKQPAYAVYASDDAGNDIPGTAPDIAVHIALSDTFDPNKPIPHLRQKKNCEHIRVTLRSKEAELAKIHRFELGPGGKPIINEEWLELNNLIQRIRVSLQQCEQNPLTNEPFLHVAVILSKP
ncbi:MAG TPA: hypothetical protein VGO50_02350 [Pyrinomonadaceae bacterium]|nr:hypothetical protein [Pyrinomonadaceae bacterium]